MEFEYNGDWTGGSTNPEGAYSGGDFSNTTSLGNYSTASDDMPVVVIVGQRPQPDPAIEALNLSAQTRELAYQIKDSNPTVTFTSGRRSVTAQASAMAANVVKQRKFIALTYKASALRDALQKWVDDHPAATTQMQIADGLMSVFNAADPAAVSEFSKHLGGDAFDVKPVNGAVGNNIYYSLKGLQTNGHGRFIDNEGGLRRWHFQR